MAKRPFARLALLGVVIAAGLGLFFWLAPTTPVIVQPAEVEVTP